MKPVNEWTRDDLEKLIVDDIRESLTLDYKSSPSLGKESKHRNELSKDVSAFANSAGGTIIYGIVEKGLKPERIDDGCDDTVISREWLEQTIGSLIQPRVQGIVIRQIPLGQERSAYAVSIPQATSLAPHQASDNKYYRRFNFQSVPMADYEVKDTLRRASTPDLFLEFHWSRPVAMPGGLATTMTVGIGNRATEPAFYSLARLVLDQGLTPVYPPDFTVVDGAATINGVNIEVHEMHRHLKIPDHQPIFKEAKWSLAQIPTIMTPNRAYLIGQSVTCPGFADERWGWIRATIHGVHYEELP